MAHNGYVHAHNGHIRGHPRDQPRGGKLPWAQIGMGVGMTAAAMATMHLMSPMAFTDGMGITDPQFRTAEDFTAHKMNVSAQTEITMADINTELKAQKVELAPEEHQMLRSRVYGAIDTGARLKVAFDMRPADPALRAQGPSETLRTNAARNSDIIQAMSNKGRIPGPTSGHGEMMKLVAGDGQSAIKPTNEAITKYWTNEMGKARVASAASDRGLFQTGLLKGPVRSTERLLNNEWMTAADKAQPQRPSLLEDPVRSAKMVKGRSALVKDAGGKPLEEPVPVEEKVEERQADEEKAAILPDQETPGNAPAQAKEATGVTQQAAEEEMAKLSALDQARITSAAKAAVRDAVKPSVLADRAGP